MFEPTERDYSWRSCLPGTPWSTYPPCALRSSRHCL